jgi:transcriptional regulator with XRE-family HTH domain
VKGRRAALLSIVSASLACWGNEVTVPDPWDAQMKALGSFIHSQRKLANLSLRQLADLTSLSNPYLSQIERGLHQPSVRVLRLLADALNVSAETLLAEAGLLEHGADADRGETEGGQGSVESVIRSDARLDDEQKAALLAVYRSMLKGQ